MANSVAYSIALPVCGSKHYYYMYSLSRILLVAISSYFRLVVRLSPVRGDGIRAMRSYQLLLSPLEDYIATHKYIYIKTSSYNAYAPRPGVESSMPMACPEVLHSREADPDLKLLRLQFQPLTLTLHSRLRPKSHLLYFYSQRCPLIAQ